MDFKRITSGFIVGLALIVLLLIQNNIITGLMFTLIAIVAMHEYLGAISKVCKPIKWISYLSCALVLLPSFISSQQLTGSLIYAIPIILLILFFSGVQILLFGILGEYLGRIFKETKNRPLYLVNEYNDEKEMNDK